MTVVTHPACALGLRLLLFFSAFLFWISAWQKDFSVPGKPRLDMWHHRHISNPSRVSKWPPSNQGWTGWSSTLPPNVLCKKKWSVYRPFQFQNLSLHLTSIELLDFLSRGCYFLGTTMSGQNVLQISRCLGGLGTWFLNALDPEELKTWTTSLFLGKEETI